MEIVNIFWLIMVLYNAKFYSMKRKDTQEYVSLSLRLRKDLHVISTEHAKVKGLYLNQVLNQMVEKGLRITNQEMKLLKRFYYRKDGESFDDIIADYIKLMKAETISGVDNDREEDEVSDFDLNYKK